MEANVFCEIMARFDKLEQFIIEKKRMNPLPDVWLDVSETCALLKISKRTLQTYRDSGILSYSQILGKIYFKAGDTDKHLRENYYKAYKK